ncbi:MAG: 5-formyltetrahydrofolate cyclo-ligase [Halorhodospira halophila]|uniref:5-formyltetrahydrofolate cyclo-ligase n=1 Tax=Halorhodospira TaxID=85108 RepID=UPI0019114EF1|nr:MULTISPECIES: 5-formyltetrahydrofolate cyclo-ligase [Halorhodospira]MCC3750160.1 5-formyltetrahydrofolate cyclo-ligase [Halorhodospira halophila]MCG5527066.1 5-formyltetrahydrofolate cyclo-ligase [Halorhodospira halophila]MCG5538832.1 5-formyltetrahydrofolate cyclo-ligase [Halorhodospira sp. 9622]MCG5541295.1 5-formyltetrahydrofolate cyclo-ligase [Halorhodospira sp. M39old]MCG5542597.1 5-formyltetrahydrofolate cyclo-ligase [Halorhodospira sp. 9628]
MAAKRDIRRRLREHRRRIPASDRRRAGLRLRDEVLRLVVTRGLHRVAGYLDADGEAPTGAILTALHQRGRAVYLPALRRHGRRMAFRRWVPGTPLRPNRYGVPEPPPALADEVPVRGLDLVLAPLVAFDPAGRRLGMGGGFYDATFARMRRYPWHPPRIVGLAFSTQQVAELPGEAWDLPLDGVITERGYVSLPVRTIRQEAA